VKSVNYFIYFSLHKVKVRENRKVNQERKQNKKHTTQHNTENKK